MLWLKVITGFELIIVIIVLMYVLGRPEVCLKELGIFLESRSKGWDVHLRYLSRIITRILVTRIERQQ